MLEWPDGSYKVNVLGKLVDKAYPAGSSEYGVVSATEYPVTEANSRRET
jgi:hypothetical protein